MADQTEYDWNEVDVDENVSKEDVDQAANLTLGTPIGQFLCTVVESKAVEKNFNAYTCIAASLKMRIDNVLKINQPVLDQGAPVTIKGVEQTATMPVTDANKAEYNKLYVGKFINDEVNLANSAEKQGMKDRRIFVAKRVGLITQDNDKLTNQHWGQMIIGKQVIITTVLNKWSDKLTGDIKSNVKVDFSGYDFASKAGPSNTTDFAGKI